MDHFRKNIHSVDFAFTQSLKTMNTTAKSGFEDLSFKWLKAKPEFGLIQDLVPLWIKKLEDDLASIINSCAIK